MQPSSRAPSALPPRKTRGVRTSGPLAGGAAQVADDSEEEAVDIVSDADLQPEAQPGPVPGPKPKPTSPQQVRKMASLAGQAWEVLL